MKDISVIIPLYNEASNIHILYEELLAAMTFVDKTFEIIFVDDGSIDSTPMELDKIYKTQKTPSVKIITFLKRYGQTQAIHSGINEASGSVIILMDGDLQNNPKDIPRLLIKLNEGYDLVNGWRKVRNDQFFFKVLPSFLANLWIRRLTKVKLHDFGCGFKAFKKTVVIDKFVLGSMHRLFALYVALKGYRTAEVIVDHRKRIQGKSKYGLLRVYELFLEMFRIYFFENH